MADPSTVVIESRFDSDRYKPTGVWRPMLKFPESERPMHAARCRQLNERMGWEKYRVRPADKKKETE